MEGPQFLGYIFLGTYPAVPQLVSGRRGNLLNPGKYMNIQVSGGTLMKKALAALALAGSIALIGAAPSVAANYPPLPPQAAVSDGVVVFRGQGMHAGEPLTISVTPGARPAATGASISGGSQTVSGKIKLPMATQSFSTVADAQGAFAFTLEITEPGTYFLTATGNNSRITVGPVAVTVVGDAAPLADTSGAPLANTGTDASLLLWGAAGIGALGLGAGAVVVTRRRAKAETAA
jgi:LPXTG-motif cell wall-anchored protein